jgi:hypothetical protein
MTSEQVLRGDLPPVQDLRADLSAATAALARFQARLDASTATILSTAATLTPANALSTADVLRYLALVKKWEPQVEAYITQGVTLVRDILTDAGYLTPAQSEFAFHAAVAHFAEQKGIERGLFGGGKFINLILTNLPEILALVDKFTAAAGDAPPPA